MISKRAFSRLLAASFFATGTFLVATVSPASAVPGPAALNTTCGELPNIVSFINNDGSIGSQVPPGTPFPLPITAPGFGGPTEVNAGESFDAVAPSASIPVPSEVDTKVTDGTIGVDGSGIVPVNVAANLTLTFEVSGAASIGTATISGGNVIDPVISQTGNKVKLVMPGTQATSLPNFADLVNAGEIIDGRELSFPKNTSFSSPKITIPVTAGAAGTTVRIKLVKFESDADVDAFGNGGNIPVYAPCTPANNTLGAVQVVTPPPPGAPDAKADVAQTNQGDAVNIAVLENDVENEELAMDTSSLAVTVNPENGTATVNADNTITYAPNADFAGTDTFTYKICSLLPVATTTTTIEVGPELAAQAVVPPVPPCDTAIVTITVLEPQETAVVPTTVAPAASTTVAAQAQLPVTGRSSVPQALAGLGLCVAGAAAVAFGRSRRAAAQS